MIAYIDPGAGSFVLQAIVATLAGVAFALRGRWRRLRARLGLGAPVDPEPPKDVPPSDG